MEGPSGSSAEDGGGERSLLTVKHELRNGEWVTGVSGGEEERARALENGELREEPREREGKGREGGWSGVG